MAVVGTIALGDPAALWFALVILPVIAAFFFRYRSRVHEIPALTHWLTIGRPIDVRSAATLLRRLLSLAAQVLLIVLLVLCLVNPFPKPPAAHRVGIVIDISATMQTAEAGGSRLAMALDKAKNIVRALAPDAQVYLITAASKPVSLHTDKMSLASALSRLDAIRPTDTVADIPAAIRAISFLSADPDARVFVLSDFAGTTSLSVLSDLWHGPAALSLISIGTDHPDCAITGCWAQPQREGWKIVAAYMSRGFSGRSATAQLISDGRVIAEKQVDLKDAPGRVEFDADLPAGATYEIVLNAGDALAVDDRAFGVLPNRPVICLVTEGDAPLERAIRANAAAELHVVKHDQYRGPGNANLLIVDGPGLRTYAVGKFHGCLYIGTGDPFGFVEAGEAKKVIAVTHWQGDHPSLVDIDPAAIQFHSAISLSPVGPDTMVPLVSAGQTPIIEERLTGNLLPVAMIYWAFNLSDTDLASRLSFPVLLWDTLDYLAGQQNDSQHATGQPLLLKASGYPPEIMGPDGHALNVRLTSDGFSTTDTGKQGIYHTVAADHRDELFAINLLSARGTLPLPRDSAISTTSVSIASQSHESFLNWRMLLIAAIVFAAIEWLLFHLRVVRIG